MEAEVHKGSATNESEVVVSLRVRDMCSHENEYYSVSNHEYPLKNIHEDHQQHDVLPSESKQGDEITKDCDGAGDYNSVLIFVIAAQAN